MAVKTNNPNASRVKRDLTLDCFFPEDECLTREEFYRQRNKAGADLTSDRPATTIHTQDNER